MHYHFQRSQALGAGAKVKTSFEHQLNRCSPAKRGAFFRKHEICTTLLSY